MSSLFNFSNPFFSTPPLWNLPNPGSPPVDLLPPLSHPPVPSFFDDIPLSEELFESLEPEGTPLDSPEPPRRSHGPPGYDAPNHASGQPEHLFTSPNYSLWM